MWRRGLSGERRRGLGQAMLGSPATEAALKSNLTGLGRPGEDMWDSGDRSAEAEPCTQRISVDELPGMTTRPSPSPLCSLLEVSPPGVKAPGLSHQRRGPE